MTAKADTSVEVATPEVTPLPIMATMMSATSAPPSSLSIGVRCSKASSGSILRPTITASTASASAITAAGTRPAMNKPAIEILATKPMMIMLMQGGMVSAMTAVQASRPAASLGSWRVRRTAGITMPPTAAMSASLEPDTPEKNAVAVMVIRPMPPRTRPKMRSSNSISRDDIPLDSISRPASTKKGIASKTKWSVPAMTCCEYTRIGNEGSDKKYSSAAKASTKPIGTPANSAPKKPSANNRPWAIACAGTSAFQPKMSAITTTLPSRVWTTTRRGPLSALATPNSVMKALPTTTGYTYNHCGRPSEVVWP